MDFAKRLFYDIVDHSDKSCEQFDSWDPVAKMIAEENGGKYDYDNGKFVRARLFCNQLR